MALVLLLAALVLPLRAQWLLVVGLLWELESSFARLKLVLPTSAMLGTSAKVPMLPSTWSARARL